MTQVDFYDKGQIDAKEIGAPDDAASASGSLWARIKNAVSRIGSLETADSNNVKKTGTSTVTGTIEVPTTPPTPTSVINSVYANDATEGVNNLMHKTGVEKVPGSKYLEGLWTGSSNLGNIGNMNKIRLPHRDNTTDWACVARVKVTNSINVIGSINGNGAVAGDFNYTEFSLRVNLGSGTPVSLFTNTIGLTSTKPEMCTTLRTENDETIAEIWYRNPILYGRPYIDDISVISVGTFVKLESYMFPDVYETSKPTVGTTYSNVVDESLIRYFNGVLIQ